MTEALRTHGVVPDVIDTLPTSLAQIVYNGNLVVEVGEELTPTQVKDQPTITWDAEPGAFYTLCMTDPDNDPSRKTVSTFSEWHHWLVVNIPGQDVSKGETLAAFIGSGPPEGTGIHRYVFLIYKQPGKLTFDERRLTRSVDHRANFSIKKFAAKYNLGDPVAGNLYQAQFDNYVPLLYKELGA